mgnify:FL=1
MCCFTSGQELELRKRGNCSTEKYDRDEVVQKQLKTGHKLKDIYVTFRNKGMV